MLAAIADQIKLELAKKMKGKGYSVDDIIELTGLSKQEIEKLYYR